MAWRYRRFLLAILAVILLARTAEWFLPNEQQPDESETISGEEFVLVPNIEGFALDDEQALLLAFNSTDGSWAYGGEAVEDFFPHVAGFDIGPHGSAPFVMIRLPDNATADTYRRAISSLADQGICRIGVASPVPALELQPDGYQLSRGEVLVYDVVRNRPDNSPSQECVSRFPAWR